MRRLRASAVGIAIVGSVLFTVTPADALTQGKIKQLSGTAGCVSDDGSGGACVDGSTLAGAWGVAVSPTGTSVYVASNGSGAVDIFDRDTTTGALTQKAGTAGCVSDDGSGGACVDGTALAGARGVAVSANGKSVYIASATSDAVDVFDRDTSTGALTQKAGTAGCVSNDGSAGACVDGTALDGASGVVMSSDDKSVYVASAASDAVDVFDRDTSTGALTQKAGTAGCVSNDGSTGACVDGTALDAPVGVTVSPNGNSVYVASSNSNAVDIFDRDATTGALTQKVGTDGCINSNGPPCATGDSAWLQGADSVAVSPDSKSVYVVGDPGNAVVVLDRDKTTGKLTLKSDSGGCVSDTGSGGFCVDGEALANPAGVTVSPDAKTVYVTSAGSAAIDVFDRDTASGKLVQKTGTGGCVSDTGSSGACADGTGLSGVRGIAISPVGRSVYVASLAGNAVDVFSRKTDPVPCKIAAPTLTGTAADDTITGSNGDDIIFGIGGNDVIKGLDGNDVLCGGKGNDKLKGGAGSDFLDGNKGTDNCSGGPDADAATRCETVSSVP